MNRVPVGLILVLALAGCAGAPSARQPVAADPVSCTGDRFDQGIRSYASCIRHVASPPRPRRAPRGGQAKLVVDGTSAGFADRG